LHLAVASVEHSCVHCSDIPPTAAAVIQVWGGTLYDTTNNSF